jgi:hypothetical protein
MGKFQSSARAFTPGIIPGSSSRACNLQDEDKKRCATGAAKLGSCPTDATREGRRRRVVLKIRRYANARTLASAIVAAFWPGGFIQASVPDLHNAYSQTGLGLLSRFTERQALNANCSNDAVAQTAVQFGLPPAKREPQMDISEYRSQLDECLANAERTDNPQHKNTWLRLAECYRKIGRPSIDPVPLLSH